MKEMISKDENNTVQAPSMDSLTAGYQAALKVVDDVVLKNYITELTNMEVVPLDNDTLKCNIANNVRLFKITEMVYEKDELATYKFASVFNALSNTDSTVFIIVDSNGEKTDFYMGVRSVDEKRTISSLKKTVENALRGQFPGVKTIDDYTVEDMESIISRINTNNVSAVSCVANNRASEQTTNKNFVQGLEKLVISMQGQKYTGVIIANSTSQMQLKELRKGYESIYTQLSALSTTQVNYTSNNAFNYALSESKGTSHSDTYQTNTSESISHQTSSSDQQSHSEARENTAARVVKGVATAASFVGLALAPVTGGASLAVGGIVSGGLGMLGSGISKNVTNSTSSSTSISDGYSTVNGSSEGTTDTHNFNISKTEGYTKGITEGMTLTIHDKSIENMLERITKQLKRIDEFESLGMYECAAYFLAEKQDTAEGAAATYKSLMRGINSGVEIAAINSWSSQSTADKERTDTALICQYVKNFIHPMFKYTSAANEIEVTPCSLVSGNELAIHMGLPRKSVSGLPVIEHADFGKEVATYDTQNSSAHQTGINLGYIFNMGSVGQTKVMLDPNSLTMHTFITGSTGSGKSNTAYEIVRQLGNFGATCMIVEPAKGEYKHIFGSQADFSVYGTNPQYTPLLKLNPFKFPKGIHVLEHIDRLIEIFNVCWPMYAAMPAVLKDSVERAYISAGWDLTTSKARRIEDVYPTFTDVLRELNAVIGESAFSQEVKDNYIGSLATRIKSLTNGIYGLIFSSDELGDATIFDQNVIIDLSRVGSSETKSMIMGLLVMRLQEYRMTSGSMNAKLKHVTILEEAHNLLKRTSTEQSSESSNLLGKSVEMLSNTIAEVRTYGEGFIIADQAPGLLDLSVIRNTNTKIIMRLPEEEDRILVGKSANLSEDQIKELAKLPTGVAAVYQSNWIEPVLCKVNRLADSDNRKNYVYRFDSSQEQRVDDAKLTRIAVELLLHKRVPDRIDIDADLQILDEYVSQSNLSAKVKNILFQLLDEYAQTHNLAIWDEKHYDTLSEYVSEIFDCKNEVIRYVESAPSIDVLNKELHNMIQQKVDMVSFHFSLAVRQSLMKTYSMLGDDETKIYALWRDETVERKGGIA